MNGLQSGSPSSQLSPQSYKNSFQSGNLQSANSSSYIVQSTGNTQSVNNLIADSNLKVIGTSNVAVLGIATSASNSSSATPTPLAVSKQNYNFTPAISIVLVVGIACVSAFFIYKRKLSANNQTESEIDTTD